MNTRFLDFVGFFERRRDDLLKLSNRLGLVLNADVVINKTNGEFDLERAHLKADARTRALLRERLAEDVAFYEHAYERWS